MAKSRKRKSSAPDVPKISCSIKHWTPNVTHQKEEDSCKAIAYADMYGTLLRMYGMYKLVLSPQQFIDEGGKFEDIEYVFLRGLYSIGVYPFKRIRCKAEAYRVKDEQSFTLNIINKYGHGQALEERVEDVIIKNFSPEESHCPLVAYIHYGKLEDPQVALDAYEIKPFKHDQEDEDKEGDHALLIVGMDNTDPDEEFHYCLIKNSQGPKWGKEGFSKVAFSVIKIVDVPDYPYQSFLNEKSRWDKYGF